MRPPSEALCEIEHRGNLLRVALGRFRHVGQARVDDARALIRGFREGDHTLVKHLRALSCGVGDDRPMRVECGAERGFVQVEHRGNLLRVIAHLVFQLRPVRIEAPAQVLHRRDDMVLELVDARSERSRDLLDAACQRLIDVPRGCRQRLRQLLSALLQRLADFRRFGAHALRDLAAALAEGSARFRGCCGRAFPTVRGRAGRARPRSAQQAFERRRDFPKFRSGALVDGFEAGVEQGGGFLVSPAEPFVDCAAAVDQGLLDSGKLGAETGGESCGSIADLPDHVAAAADESLLDRRKLGAKIGSESCGSIADLPDDVAAAPVDRALEPRETVAKRRLDAPRMGCEREFDRVVMSGRGGLELLQSRRRFRLEMLGVVGEAPVELVATGLHHHVDRVEMSSNARVQLVGTRPYAVNDAVPAFADETIQGFEMFAHAPGLSRHGFHEGAASPTLASKAVTFSLNASWM